MLWSLLLIVAVFFPRSAISADAKTGVVKGTITIGGRPARDAVVSVEGLPQRKIQGSELKTRRAVMDQREIKFIPRVLPVLAGTTVEFPNNDKAWHNVFSTSEAKKFDLGLYPPGKSRSMTFDKPGVVRILCNVHPEMEAYVVVKQHPYLAAADVQGNYRLNAVPLGKYRLQVWHPEFGTKDQPFNLAREGEVLAIDFDLKRQR